MKHNTSVSYHLSHPQQRIWFTDKINTGSQLHNIGGWLEISGQIDLEVMIATINQVIFQNEGLRLRFKEIVGQPVQYLQEYEPEVIDFKYFGDSEQEKEKCREWIDNVFKSPMRLTDNKLYQFYLFRQGSIYGVVFNIHHIISDGWSINLIQKQICQLYNTLLHNSEAIDNQVYSYLDYLEEERLYLNSERCQKNRRYWLDKFRNNTDFCLYKGSLSLNGNRLSFLLEKQTADRIRLFLHDKRYSFNTFFITAMLLYVYKTTNQTDITVGTPLFNRSNRKQKNMVGMFTSTMPFRYKLDISMPLHMILDSVNDELKACYYHQKYPYDCLLKDLEIHKHGYDSLFKISVNYYNTIFHEEIDSMDIAIKEAYCGEQAYSLQLTVKEEENDTIILNFDYKTKEYAKEAVTSIYRSVLNIADQMVNMERINVEDVVLIGDEEKYFKIVERNKTEQMYPEKTVVQLFEEQVSRAPDRIAAEFEQERIRYDDLNKRSNQLARYLQTRGIKREAVVGIMQTHSIDLLVSILAVVKAGAAYLPIDPEYPSERAAYMIQDSGCRLILVKEERERYEELPCEWISVDRIELHTYSSENLYFHREMSDLVYIIYTSGSTGKPKGVMVEHRGLTNYICFASNQYLENDDDSFALYSSVSFDLTVTSIFAPLISGHRIIIYDNSGEEFVLYRIINDRKATVVKLTPSHLSLLKGRTYHESAVRCFVIGGEELRVDLAKEILHSFHEKVCLYNEYGPTETVIGCMIHKYMEEEDTGLSVPIGHGIDNTQIYILDQNYNIVPDYVDGEIFISGDGVSRGYRNHPFLTAEKFLNNPFVKNKKMYRTNDTGYYFKNGNIMFRGRSDNQIKIRGYRIEPGEIESCLLKRADIREAFVTVWQEKHETNFLTAYLVSDTILPTAELKAWLQEFLPQYMIPNFFLHLESLPLTINGKVNISLLPKPAMEKMDTEEPKNSMEEILRSAVQEILTLSEISMTDSFFGLGGDSIKAIQISSLLKGKGYTLKEKHILTSDTIRESATFMRKDDRETDIDQGISKGVIMETPIMKWFFEQNFKEPNRYNQYLLLRDFKGFEAKTIQQALQMLVDHHDALRMNYNRETKKLYYNNSHLQSNLLLKIVEIPKKQQEKEFLSAKELIELSGVKFDLEHTPLFQGVLLCYDGHPPDLLLMAHHLIVDGITWRILSEDLYKLLEHRNKNEDFIPKTHSYQHWAETLMEYSKTMLVEEKKYWSIVVDKINRTNTFTKNFKNKGSRKLSTLQLLEGKTLQELTKHVMETYHMDLNEILITALVLTLKKLTDSDEIAIELERHGRESIADTVNITRTAGWFTNIYPIYVTAVYEDMNNNIKSIKEQLRTVPKNGIDYGILKYLKQELEPIVDKPIRFNYLGDINSTFKNNGFQITKVEAGLDTADCNISSSGIELDLILIENQLTMTITSYEVETNDRIDELVQAYQETLKQINNECLSKGTGEFTPSDFDSDVISQKDLEQLFG